MSLDVFDDLRITITPTQDIFGFYHQRKQCMKFILPHAKVEKLIHHHITTHFLKQQFASPKYICRIALQIISLSHNMPLYYYNYSQGKCINLSKEGTPGSKYIVSTIRY